MIRKRKDIDIDIEAGKATLNDIIEESLRVEKECEDDTTALNKELSELASETCFEDTFEGRSRALEDTVFEKIEEILGELSEATGKDYMLSLPTTFLSTLSTYSDCPRPFFSRSGESLIDIDRIKSGGASHELL